MIDLVGKLQDYCADFDWMFSYGNKSNQNLLKSDRVVGRKYLLLDPITRTKGKSENGGEGRLTFSGQFILVVKSTIDARYEKKYEDNIEPLLQELLKLENALDCSDYQIEDWQVIDIVNALDINTDGLLVTFKISTL